MFLFVTASAPAGSGVCALTFKNASTAETAQLQPAAKRQLSVESLVRSTLRCGSCLSFLGFPHQAKLALVKLTDALQRDATLRRNDSAWLAPVDFIGAELHLAHGWRVLWRVLRGAAYA